MDDIGPKKIKDSYQLLVQSDGESLYTADAKTQLFNIKDNTTNLNTLKSNITELNDRLNRVIYVIDGAGKYSDVETAINDNMSNIETCILQGYHYFDVVYNTNNIELFTSLTNRYDGDFGNIISKFAISLRDLMNNKSTTDGNVVYQHEYKLHFAVSLKDGSYYAWGYIPCVYTNVEYDYAPEVCIPFTKMRDTFGYVFDCEVIFRCFKNDTGVINIHYNIMPMGTA